MDNLFKKPYEISLWDDDLTFKVFAAQEVTFSDVLKYEKDKYYYLNNFQVSTSGSGAVNQFIIDGAETATEGRQYYTYGELLDEKIGSMESKDYGTLVLIVQYYKERKICTIGSDTMNTPIRAVQGKLVSNINGSNTLTFAMYSRYYDEEVKEYYTNPYLKLLVNERKVKLRYGAIGEADCKWYDFIIKNVQENSDTKTFSYTCKDLFINELSKSGFNLVLNAELVNNMGNIETLATTILEESDWQLGVGSSKLIQTKEEPLYLIQLNTEITATNMQNDNETIKIAKDEYIYGFYTPITNQEPYFQFLYCEDDKYEIDDDHVITNSQNWYLDGMKYTDNLPLIAESMVVSGDYRGDRLIRQAKIVYDATIDKYVYVYKDSANTEFYGYTESDYISPSAVSNYITSPNSFTSDAGWEVGGVKIEGAEATQYPTLGVQGYPDIRDIEQDDIVDTTFESFLKLTTTHDGQLLYNSGLADSRSRINNFIKGEKYVFRIKYATATENDAGRPENIIYQRTAPKILAGVYKLEDGVYNITKTLFNSEDIEASHDDISNWITIIVDCKEPMEYSQMIVSKLGLFLDFKAIGTFYIQDVEFFPYKTYKDTNGQNQMIIPGGELVSLVKTKYYIYEPNKNYDSIEDVKFVYEGDQPSTFYTQVYNDGENKYEKIRSITASESNRFNLIQELCEIFECWPKFIIDHNMVTGEILLDENYRQKKWVTFHEYIGKDNYAGFKYGINLKSIQRTLDSDGIVSKLIVKDNANEFADNGFCSIARSKENPCGENFIYDFNYYIQQGLLGFSEVNNDLYLDVDGYLGYYKKLRSFNLNRDKLIEEQVNLIPDISQYESNYQVYKVSVEEAEEELKSTHLYIENLVGYSYENMIKIYNNNPLNPPLTEEQITEAKNWWERDEFIVQINKLSQLTTRITQHKKMRDQAKIYLDGAQARLDELTKQLEDLLSQKKTLHLQFYKKYSRFIQEGSWINEDYVDDNLYYLDAESTLHTSAQPKVTYTINVLELSQIKDYENYTFALGDKTYIEDTEFFGWVWKNGIQTPYHEEIVVSEITLELDSPEKNVIKVQNYKTQFEDLFQRITATTQSVEYHTGEYAKASSVIESDGTIGIVTLQNSISNNALTLQNSRDQSVVWDETGITTTSLARPNEMVRLVSGGLFLSRDGGVTWSTGITGAGINANYLTAGQINTDKIFIMNGGFPSFRWDGNGISAYEFSIDSTGKPYGFNTSKFVRFDQYGLYGIKGNENFIANSEQDIWNNAKFALTWRGFQLKNDDGSVRITSSEDIQVLADEKERIKIGRINENVYGIRISNADGAPVMETDDSGELWLKNRLHIGTGETSTVKIGYLDAVRTETETEVHEVIHAGNGEQEFIVYEDGKMVAQGAEFHGAIYATGGEIGNMTIGDVEGAIGNMNSIAEATKKLDISSKLGYNFKIEGNVSSPTALELIATPTAFTVNASGINWFGSNDFESWIELANNTSTYTLTYEDFKEKQLNSTYYIKVVATATDGTSYEDWTTIMSISDGEKGETGASAIYSIIESSAGDKFTNGNVATTLKCRIFDAYGEIDLAAPYKYTYTWKKYVDGIEDSDWRTTGQVIGKTVIIEPNDVTIKATFSCTVTITVN